MKIHFLTSILFFSYLFLNIASSQEVGSGSGVSNGTSPSYSVMTYDPQPTNRRNTSPDCHNFIDHRGRLGEYGNMLIEGINASPEVAECFYNQANFSRICPQYVNFNRERKNQFIAFLFASMSAYEATCRVNERAPGTYGTAVGLLGLEFEPHLRRYRPPVCSTPGPTPMTLSEVQNPRYQMVCGAAIFNQVYCTDFTGIDRSQRIVGIMRGGKWQELNGNRGGSFRKISTMASQFPGCR